MAIGDRIRIISEEEFRIMSPPRRPKGEKPATTIRILRRQLATAQQTIAALQLDRADKEKVIAGYDVQLSEADDALIESRRRADAAEHQAASLREFIADRSAELEFFRGYYAKSQETAPRRPISAAGGYFPDHQTQAHTGGRPGNPENLSAQRQTPKGTGADYGAAGFDAGFGDEVRSQHLDDQAPPNRRQVEHVEITEGPQRHSYSQSARIRHPADDWMAQ